MYVVLHREAQRLASHCKAHRQHERNSISQSEIPAKRVQKIYAGACRWRRSKSDNSDRHFSKQNEEQRCSDLLLPHPSAQPAKGLTYKIINLLDS
jgi:hypothetical protein